MPACHSPRVVASTAGDNTDNAVVDSHPSRAKTKANNDNVKTVLPPAIQESSIIPL